MSSFVSQLAYWLNAFDSFTNVYSNLEFYKLMVNLNALKIFDKEEEWMEKLFHRYLDDEFKPLFMSEEIKKIFDEKDMSNSEKCKLAMASVMIKIYDSTMVQILHNVNQISKEESINTPSTKVQGKEGKEEKKEFVENIIKNLENRIPNLDNIKTSKELYNNLIHYNAVEFTAYLKNIITVLTDKNLNMNMTENLNANPDTDINMSINLDKIVLSVISFINSVFDYEIDNNYDDDSDNDGDDQINNNNKRSRSNDNNSESSNKKPKIK